MRRAVRRLTWILLSFGLITVLCFGLLDRFVPGPRGARTLPRFVNPSPRNVRDLALRALDGVVKNGADRERAAAELARLGGAALPYVLPSFERLDAQARERAALALTPVALRMGAARPEEIASGGAAVSFWLRFWQDRSVDFREPVVRRLVARLAERSLALRREDVLELDTYALPALVAALGSVKTDDDVRRVRRLTTVLAHVAGQPWTIERGATVNEAARLVRRWQTWWEVEGSDFTALDGPHRVAAMIKDTAYGHWLLSVVRGELGRTSDGRTGVELLRAAAPRTLGAFGGVLLFGTLLGALVASRISLGLADEHGWLGGGAAVLAALPVAVLFARSSGVGTFEFVLAVALLVLVHAALVVFTSSRSGASQAGFRAGLLHAVELSVPQAPVLFGTLLAVECALGRGGLGSELRAAVARADLHALMALSLCGAAASLAAILLADAASALLGRPAPHRELP